MDDDGYCLGCGADFMHGEQHYGDCPRHLRVAHTRSGEWEHGDAQCAPAIPIEEEEVSWILKSEN